MRAFESQIKLMSFQSKRQAEDLAPILYVTTKYVKVKEVNKIINSIRKHEHDMTRNNKSDEDVILGEEALFQEFGVGIESGDPLDDEVILD